MRRIPDGWLDYERIGKLIEGTRFVAFKVPLNESLCEMLPEEERFGVSDLISGLEERSLRLGLVIDLTNTTKYYRRDNIERLGVGYTKIFTEGHVVPSIDVQNTFSDNVDEFLKENAGNSDVIGVHCTHGLNRTGYLVCRYMIDKMQFSPENAIEAFNKARGHPIERQNYLDDLRGIASESESLQSPTGAKRKFTWQGGPSPKKGPQANPASFPSDRSDYHQHRDYHSYPHHNPHFPPPPPSFYGGYSHPPTYGMGSGWQNEGMPDQWQHGPYGDRGGHFDSGRSGAWQFNGPYGPDMHPIPSYQHGPSGPSGSGFAIRGSCDYHQNGFSDGYRSGKNYRDEQVNRRGVNDESSKQRLSSVALAHGGKRHLHESSRSDPPRSNDRFVGRHPNRTWQRDGK